MLISDSRSIRRRDGGAAGFRGLRAGCAGRCIYDDFAGFDLRGKIAVFITGGPRLFRALYGRTSVRRASAAGHWRLRASSARSASRIRKAWTSLGKALPWRGFEYGDEHCRQPGRESRASQLAVTLNPARAGKSSSRGPDRILSGLDGPRGGGQASPALSAPFTPGPGRRWSGRTWNRRTSPASCRGTDPVLKNEYVRPVGASRSPGRRRRRFNGDRIYNGAMDNASGVAALLEMADRSAANRQRSLRRSSVRRGDRRGERSARLEFFAHIPTVDRKQHRRRPEHGHVPAAVSAATDDGATAWTNPTSGPRSARWQRASASRFRTIRNRSATFSFAAISTASSGRACPRWRSRSDTTKARPKNRSQGLAEGTVSRAVRRYPSARRQGLRGQV